MQNHHGGGISYQLKQHQQQQLLLVILNSDKQTIKLVQDNTNNPDIMTNKKSSSSSLYVSYHSSNSSTLFTEVPSRSSNAIASAFRLALRRSFAFISELVSISFREDSNFFAAFAFCCVSRSSSRLGCGGYPQSSRRDCLHLTG